jgi:anti-sigma factor RsiW
MSAAEFTDDELVAYLDEMLSADRMAALEAALRKSDSLRQRLAATNRRRDVGVHSVGEIWRRKRLSCPSRTQLGSFLLGTLDSELAAYIDFHIRSVGCRICAANLHDLQESSKVSGDAPERRRRFFESSAGTLRNMSTKKR